MIDQLWTAILDVVAQIIVPTWNDLIQYIPLLVILGLLAVVAGLAWMWQRNAAGNRSRVPRPVPAGRKPDDMHLPGPSLWPFVAPIGLFFIVFGVALGVFDSFAHLALVLLGLLVVSIGLLGWYLDAGREYAHAEAGGHGAGDAAVVPGWALTPPAGMHLPGPSAWPLLAPVGLLFLALGLIFGAAMLLGGLIMAVIALIGWLADANRELSDVEAHGHPSQADRDPRKAWPARLIPLYVLVGGAAIVLTVLPWLLSLLPGGGG
jgi:hypothetical protein